LVGGAKPKRPRRAYSTMKLVLFRGVLGAFFSKYTRHIAPHSILSSASLPKQQSYSIVEYWRGAESKVLCGGFRHAKQPNALNNNNRLVLRLRWCVAKHDFALFCVIEKKVCTCWSDVRPWTLSGCCGCCFFKGLFLCAPDSFFYPLGSFNTLTSVPRSHSPPLGTCRPMPHSYCAGSCAASPSSRSVCASSAATETRHAAPRTRSTWSRAP
jgi:hypothetical protein